MRPRGKGKDDAEEARRQARHADIAVEVPRVQGGVAGRVGDGPPRQGEDYGQPHPDVAPTGIAWDVGLVHMFRFG